MRVITRRLCATPPLGWKRVTVVGGGLMGGGIAEVACCASFSVSVLEASPERAETAKKQLEKNVRASFQRRKERGKKPEEQSLDVEAAAAEALARVRFFSSAAEAVADSDVVVEAILENMDAKKALWKSLDALAPPSTVFASNTSSLSIQQQAEVTSRADRFGGLHFFSPVPRMDLVEVVRTDATSDATAASLKAFGAALGKRPIAVRDTKGFIVNRLLVPYLLEAARLVERGVATKEDVDTAMKLGAGHPMGPFTLMDGIGLDVIDGIVRAWAAEEPGNPLFVPSESISALVKQGKLGRKTKEGFFKY